MFRYLVRRVGLLIVNIVAVTLLVFMLGRVLPGVASPEQQLDSQGVGEIHSSVTQWYDQRYGLDQPLHLQYMRWWRSMFTAKRQVLYWTNEQPARAIFTIGKTIEGERLFIRSASNGWNEYHVQSKRDVRRELVESCDVQLSRQLNHRDYEILSSLVHRKNAPLHQFIDGEVGQPIDEAALQNIQRAGTTVERFMVTLGWSRATNESVWVAMKRRLPITATIGVLSVVLIYLIAIPIGIISAAKQGGWYDRLIHGTSLIAWSVPMVLVATLLLGWLAGGVGIFPLGGVSSAGAEEWPFVPWLIDRVWHLVLPVAVLTLPAVAYVSRQVRSSVLEQLDADYMRTALAKGLSRGQAIRRHALRPAMLVVVTMLATVLPVVIGGSIIVETLFGIDGMGRFVYHAVRNRDYDVVQSFALMAAASNMGGVLLADIMYVLIDPRVSYTSADASS